MGFWETDMKRALSTFFFSLLFLIEGLCAAQSLKFDDISPVMGRIFSFHIDSKELNTTIVRRSLKLYIEQFDPEKIYLLEGELKPFLELSDRKAYEILSRIKAEDYSDFLALNALMQRSVVRARKIRAHLEKEMVHREPMQETSNRAVGYGSFASGKKELAKRQKERLKRFYFYHKARTALDTEERRGRVFSLFEKRVKRGENGYLFLDDEGRAFGQRKIESFLTLRILKALAKSLDTHTSFFSPQEALEMRMTLEKNFEGVGIVLSEGIDGVMIAELIKGSPAEESGQIHVNDLLVEIDGVPTQGISFEEVLEMLKQKGQGQVILGFLRADSEENAFFRVPLLKRAISMNEERIQASYERAPGGGIIGKVKLHSFYESSNGISSERDIKEAIRLFREKGELVGLVLDLRENSGGFLSQAVKVTGLFISNGVVVVSKYGHGEKHYLRNIAAKAFYNGPLVVLTSKMSASASEIVAQALQDYGVALIVGDKRTFGKGSIQYQTVTDTKADMFFKVTVGKYYTASGKSTQLSGVSADIVVPSWYAPFKIGEKYLEYPLKKDSVEPVFHDTLRDLDERTRNLFKERYLPSAQRVVGFWKKMLPVLREKSAERLAKSPHFQAFKEKRASIRARHDTLLPNTVDEHTQVTKEDIQMQEAVHILEDMIFLEEKSRFPETGTD